LCPFLALSLSLRSSRCRVVSLSLIGCSWLEMALAVRRALGIGGWAASASSSASAGDVSSAQASSHAPSREEVARMEAALASVPPRGAVADPQLVRAYLCACRALRLRRSELVCKHGQTLLLVPRSLRGLRDEAWDVAEQVALAAMDCGDFRTAHACVLMLQDRFPRSRRVELVRAALLEAQGKFAEARGAYDALRKADPADPLVWKRLVALRKSQGDAPGALDELGRYLDVYSNDADAWEEAADLNVQAGAYSQAAFCLEEVLLSCPTNWRHHLAYAEVLHTLAASGKDVHLPHASKARGSGGASRASGPAQLRALAKSYYSAALELSGYKSARAMHGLHLVGLELGDGDAGRGGGEADSSDPRGIHPGARAGAGAGEGAGALPAADEVRRLAGGLLLQEYRKLAPGLASTAEAVIEELADAHGVGEA